MALRAPVRHGKASSPASISASERILPDEALTPRPMAVGGDGRPLTGKWAHILRNANFEL